MPEDDDEDCPGHAWRLRSVVVGAAGAGMAHECERCGTVTYEASRAELDGRGGDAGT